MALAITEFLVTNDDDSGKLIATEPINAGSGIALTDAESYDATMTVASQPSGTIFPHGRNLPAAPIVLNWSYATMSE